MNDISYFQNRYILASKNTIVEKINDYMLYLIPGEKKTYLSYDTHPCNLDGDDVHIPNFFNTFTTL